MSGRAPERLERSLQIIGAASLAVLMVVVFVDVVGRNLLNRPLPWGTELLEVVLALMVFALYPVLALRSAHITVDLVQMPERLQRLQRALSCGVGAALFAILAWCTGRQALRSAAYGDASALLHIPTAWVLWGMSLASAAAALAFLLALTRPAPATAAPQGTGH